MKPSAIHSHYNIAMLILLLFLVIFLLPAHAATIPSTSGISNIPALLSPTAPDEPSLSSNYSTVEGGFQKWFCTGSQAWNQPALELGDCHGMLQYFYHETMADGGRKAMEFLSPGAKRTRHSKGQATPRKYTFGKCQGYLLHPVYSNLPQLASTSLIQNRHQVHGTRWRD